MISAWWILAWLFITLVLCLLCFIIGVALGAPEDDIEPCGAVAPGKVRA